MFVLLTSLAHALQFLWHRDMSPSQQHKQDRQEHASLHIKILHFDIQDHSSIDF